jgi:hypothetical protein
MVVIKAGAIPQHQIALDFDVAQLALRILREVVGLVGILPQFLHSETADISMRIFARVIPPHPNPGLSGAANQGD